MRIAFVGSHGTGKTSLLNAIELEGHRKITEVSRSLIEEMGFNPLVGDSSLQDKIDFEKNILERQIFEETGDFVSDRSKFDVLAYASTLVPQCELSDLCSLAISHYSNHPYDILFFIPIEFPMEKDGIRPENEEYRKEIEERMLAILKFYNVPYVTINGTVEERLEQIYHHVCSKIISKSYEE